MAAEKAALAITAAIETWVSQRFTSGDPGITLVFSELRELCNFLQGESLEGLHRASTSKEPHALGRHALEWPG
jgi:hypothetical protein